MVAPLCWGYAAVVAKAEPEGRGLSGDSRVRARQSPPLGCCGFRPRSPFTADA